MRQADPMEDAVGDEYFEMLSVVKAARLNLEIGGFAPDACLVERVRYMVSVATLIGDDTRHGVQSMKTLLELVDSQ